MMVRSEEKVMLHSSFRYEHIENGMLKRIDCLLKYQFGNAGPPILYFNTLRRNGRRYLYSNEFISAERETVTVLCCLIGNRTPSRSLAERCGLAAYQFPMETCLGTFKFQNWCVFVFFAATITLALA